MKVTVHKCRSTGKLFEDDKKFAAHLGKLRDEQRHLRERERIAARWDEFLLPLYELGTTDEIVAWLNENYMKVSAFYGPKWRRKKPYIPTPEDHVEFRIRDCYFVMSYATTHTAPRGQKTTGWGKEPTVSEPAWRGRIDLLPKGNTYREELVNCDHLKHIGINTGSGGGSERHLSYELILYAKDFRKLRQLAAVNQVLKEHGRPIYDSNRQIVDTKERSNIF